jgi:hypothetical protein
MHSDYQRNQDVRVNSLIEIKEAYAHTLKANSGSLVKECGRDHEPTILLPAHDSDVLACLVGDEVVC